MLKADGEEAPAATEADPDWVLSDLERLQGEIEARKRPQGQQQGARAIGTPDEDPSGVHVTPRQVEIEIGVSADEGETLFLQLFSLHSLFISNPLFIIALPSCPAMQI